MCERDCGVLAHMETGVRAGEEVQADIGAHVWGSGGPCADTGHQPEGLVQEEGP